ncbi:oxygen-independent coproporphyrinogen III oxidase [Pedobacter nototheniae]|uniref:oxygen-independent coproporphyrinogen III oxidase n=1 Tax=Pedobacter nototheniae TaxID=2488994 RepID=UPI00292FF80A|nr:oxygen-independent coproporphyrinogen III oxidase [Pedobacter nototheniae]
MDTAALLKKYNVAAPRYTSYPTVPYWDAETFSTSAWLESVQKTYLSHQEEGISLYIHLPFCESLCTYCGCNTRITKNHEVEKPYIQALLKEWQMYLAVFGSKPKIRELHLGGGTPTFFSAENLNDLILGILDYAYLAADAELSFEAHPANTSALHLQVLYQLGFKRLSLGIQDFDPKVQLMINRFQSPEQVFKVTEEARRIGYESINFDLIYGLPAQNIGGLTETIEAVIAMQPDRIAFYSYAHVPWLKPGQRHYSEKDLPQGDAKFALYNLGKDLLLHAGYGDIGMDHFALKDDSLYRASTEKKLHRNFMGYTNQHTHLLIGLGVSSISDCWTGFSQNSKMVEVYLDKINAGILPAEKGHILSTEDLIIRQHILDIMCRNQTFFNEGIAQSAYERLRPLIKDKLVSVTEKELNVTYSGMSFLRNICMALDERLWLKQPTSSIFSAAV